MCVEGTNFVLVIVHVWIMASWWQKLFLILVDYYFVILQKWGYWLLGPRNLLRKTNCHIYHVSIDKVHVLVLWHFFLVEWWLKLATTINLNHQNSYSSVSTDSLSVHLNMDNWFHASSHWTQSHRCCRDTSLIIGIINQLIIIYTQILQQHFLIFKFKSKYFCMPLSCLIYGKSSINIAYHWLNKFFSKNSVICTYKIWQINMCLWLCRHTTFWVML